MSTTAAGEKEPSFLAIRARGIRARVYLVSQNPKVEALTSDRWIDSAQVAWAKLPILTLRTTKPYRCTGHGASPMQNEIKIWTFENWFRQAQNAELVHTVLTEQERALIHHVGHNALGVFFERLVARHPNRVRSTTVVRLEACGRLRGKPMIDLVRYYERIGFHLEDPADRANVAVHGKEFAPMRSTVRQILRAYTNIADFPPLIGLRPNDF